MRIVVKVGTSTITHENGALNIRRMEELVKVMSDLKNAGHQMILVSSGAIAMGSGKLHMKERPADMPTKQAAAAVGQAELMYIYDRQFAKYNHTVAQILLIESDVETEERRTNFVNTIERLLDLGTLPVINENDTVATSEIAVGDNDKLGAIVAKEAEADLLVLMSDVDGLYTADPKKDSNAMKIDVVDEIGDLIWGMAGGRGSEFATGGMWTKLEAAEIIMEAGRDMILMDGRNPSLLYDVAEGKTVGTRFSSARAHTDVI